MSSAHTTPGISVLDAKIHDDNKHKDQSVSVSASHEFSTINGSSIHVVIFGYGKNENEARVDFVRERKKLEREAMMVFGIV